MRGLLRLLTVTAIVMVIGAAALATPSVVLLSFNPTTFEYIYEVTLPTGGGDTLNQLTVNAYMIPAQASINHMADVTGNPGNGGNWAKGLASWSGTTYKAYRWRSGSATAGWVGQFKLTIPDSHLASGSNVVATSSMGGTTSFSLDVPQMNLTPEPSALAGMSLMLLGIAPVLKRLRRK